MRTIAVLQARGGAGKSTVCSHVGFGLAQAGIRTLLIDLVPGGGSSRYLGVSQPPGAPDLWDVLRGRAELDAAAIRLGEPSLLSVVPATTRLTGYEYEMRGPYRLRVALAPLRRLRYQCVLIDTGPSSSLSTRKALAAATGALIVVETKAPGIDALERQIALIEEIQEQMNPELSLLGIIPSRVSRTRLSRLTLTALKAEHPGLLLPPIRECTSIAEAPLHHRPVSSTAPRSIGSRDFERLLAALALRLGYEARFPKTEHEASRRPRWVEPGTLSGRRVGWPPPESRPLPKSRRTGTSSDRP